MTYGAVTSTFQRVLNGAKIVVSALFVLKCPPLFSRTPTAKQTALKN